MSALKWMAITHAAGLLIASWGAANLFGDALGGSSGTGGLTAIGLGAMVVAAGPVRLALVRRSQGSKLASVPYVLVLLWGLVGLSS